MILLQSLLTIGVLLIGALTPGLFFVRYLRWRPLETLCGSVALSFFLLYLAAFLIYGFGLAPACAYVPTGLSVVAALVCKNDLRRLWNDRETRATILAYLAILAWLLLLIVLVRNFSGGRWFGDWFEHYQRERFFTDGLPLDTKFLGSYPLPARPPMMNLLSAQISWQVSSRFDQYQIVFAFLNALVFLPCSLIAPSLVARTKYRAWLIAGFMALNPMFVQNCVYTWTKLFAAFYALTAVGLYLAAWRRNSVLQMVAAFACLAAAMLVHYSAAPFLLFLGGHYLFVLFRRRRDRWRELILSLAAGAAILFTWVGWSLHAYGWKDTFGSNTTVLGSQEYTLAGNVGKFFRNFFTTLAPFPLRGSFQSDEAFNPQFPPRGLAFVRDWCFNIYQTSFPAMLGLGASVLVLWLLARLFIRRPADRRQHRYGFWLGCTITVTLIGIALVGSEEFFGIGHICLQPLVLIGLTYAAVGLPHVPYAVRGLALFGLLIDAVFGVLLHIHMLHGQFLMSVQGDQLVVSSNLEMGMIAVNNGILKLRTQLECLGEHLGSIEAGTLEFIAAVGAVAICIGLWMLAMRPRAGPVA